MDVGFRADPMVEELVIVEISRSTDGITRAADGLYEQSSLRLCGLA
jgi:hypothetical protein